MEKVYELMIKSEGAYPKYGEVWRFNGSDLVIPEIFSSIENAEKYLDEFIGEYVLKVPIKINEQIWKELFPESIAYALVYDPRKIFESGEEFNDLQCYAKASAYAFIIPKYLDKKTDKTIYDIGLKLEESIRPPREAWNWNEKYSKIMEPYVSEYKEYWKRYRKEED